jgi:hypothetical protein
MTVHRPSIAPAPGLRAGGLAVPMVPQTTLKLRKEVQHVSNLFLPLAEFCTHAVDLVDAAFVSMDDPFGGLAPSQLPGL